MAEAALQSKLNLDAFAQSLPKQSALYDRSNVDEQARATLHLLLSEIRTGVSPPQEPATPDKCPNCGRPCQSLRTPYCSCECREEAALVRQIRSGLATATILDPDRQTAFGEKLWHVLGGGYPRRKRRITEKDIQRVLTREGGNCEFCGMPAFTVDHVGSG